MGHAHGKLLHRPASLWQQVKENNKQWNRLSVEERTKLHSQRPYVPLYEEDEEELRERELEMKDFYDNWTPANAAEAKSQKAPKVGYLKPELDRR